MSPGPGAGSDEHRAEPAGGRHADDDDHDHGRADDHGHGHGQDHGHEHEHGAHGAARISRLDRALVVLVTVVAAVVVLRPGLAYVAAWRADALIAGGRNAQGLSMARRQLLLTPKDPALWDLAGAALARLGRLGEAEAAYRRVLELRPSSTEHHRLLGQLALRQERYATAIPFFTEALRRDPSDPLNWRGLALAQERSGRLAEAARTWEGFARRFPEGDGERQAARVRARAAEDEGSGP